MEQDQFKKNELYRINAPGVKGFGVYLGRKFDVQRKQWVYSFRSNEFDQRVFMLQGLQLRNVYEMDRVGWTKFQTEKRQLQKEMVNHYKLSITDRTLLLLRGKKNYDKEKESSIRLKNSLDKLTQLGLLKTEKAPGGLINFVLTDDGKFVSHHLYSSEG